MTRPQNVRWASIEQYRSPTMPRHISAQEAQIVACLEQRGPGMGGDWTRREMAKALGMETSTMSARVNALIRSGIVVECCERRCTAPGAGTGNVAGLALTGAGRA